MAQPARQKSTIVRSQTHALRKVLQALDVVMPALGARIAEPMWFRLPGTQARSAKAATNGQAVLDVSGTPFEVLSQGHVIRGHYWGHGPVVYLLHGWGGNSRQLRPLVGPLVDAGLRVVAHDAPSHGRSDPGVSGPNHANAVEMARSLEAVIARFGEPTAIVTHSMGALATMLALREGWVGCERLVLISPVTGVPDLSVMFRDRLGFGERTQTRIEERAGRRVGYPVEELDLRRLSREIERPQLFVVHDELDRDTPYAASADLVGSWPGARFLSTSGLGHHRILGDAGVVQAVAWFVLHGTVTLDLGDKQRPRPHDAVQPRESVSAGSAARAVQLDLEPDGGPACDPFVTHGV